MSAVIKYVNEGDAFTLTINGGAESDDIDTPEDGCQVVEVDGTAYLIVTTHYDGDAALVADTVYSLQALPTTHEGTAAEFEDEEDEEFEDEDEETEDEEEDEPDA